MARRLTGKGVPASRNIECARSGMSSRCWRSAGTPTMTSLIASAGW
jgi:hypothetical protein